jgi:ribosomal protein S2
LAAEDHDVLLGAADTFRAAAAEQLVTWGERAGVPVVRGAEGADPASVAFEAVSAGVDNDVDVVIVDTAGRLHTKTGLMDELSKIQRNLSGIRDMVRLPDALVVVDPKREHIAVQEAQRMGIAVLSLIDTDSDPDTIDLAIPGNDDSIRSIELIVGKLADAVVDGRAANVNRESSQQAMRPRPERSLAERE